MHARINFCTQPTLMPLLLLYTAVAAATAAAGTLHMPHH